MNMNYKIRVIMTPYNVGFSYNATYSPDEIQQLLVKADEPARVIILLLASTGVRIGAIPGLKLKRLIKVDDFNL